MYRTTQWEKFVEQMYCETAKEIMKCSMDCIVNNVFV